MLAHGTIIGGTEGPHGGIGCVRAAYFTDTAVTVINHFAGNFGQGRVEPIFKVEPHRITEAFDRFCGSGLVASQIKVDGFLQRD